MTFEEVDDVNRFDIFKNRWFQTIDFWLLGHTLNSLEDFGDLINKLIDL